MHEQSVGEDIEDNRDDRTECGECEPEDPQQTNMFTHSTAAWKSDASTCREFLSAFAAEPLVRLHRAAAFVAEHGFSPRTHFYYHEIRTTSEECSRRSRR